MNLPHRLDIPAMAARIKESEIFTSLPLMRNLIAYADQGILPISDLIKLGKNVKFSTTEITWYITKIDTEPELFAFARFIKRLDVLGMLKDYNLICKYITTQLLKIYHNSS